VVLKESDQEHRLIQSPCPEQNGLIERANRTTRESLENPEFSSYVELQATLATIRRSYNEDRLNGALGYLPRGSSIPVQELQG
jgi:transposase InsO family protein